MSRKARWIVAVLAVAALAAVIALLWAARKPTVPAPRGAASAASAASTTAPAVAIELAPTDVATAMRAELVRSLTVSGSLKAVQSAIVKAKVAAEIRQLDVREGDRVKAGQLLGRLDATEFEWRQRQSEDLARSAEAQLQIAERTLANNRALVDQGFISKNALDTSVSSETSARATLQAARAAAELARKSVQDTEIRAPIGGLVAQRLVQPGERVPVDGRLLEIVDLSRIELEAAVAPEDVLAVRVGQSARLFVDGMAEPLQARVARINPSAQAGTRAVPTYLELPPHPGLRQGLFARATIEVQRLDALVVPASAVRFDLARPYVLAVDSGTAVERPVTLGARGEAAWEGPAEAAVEVTSGLAAGATVLRASVGNLRAGTQVRLATPAARAGSIPPSAARP
jgi:RND family efflux transporter MFP subunit